MNEAGRVQGSGGDGRRARRRWSVPLVKIGGVTIRVHVTFLALVLLVALAAGEAGESAAAAVGWLVVLFACVVAHELAHAFVARSRGVAVREIDLLPIGGVSRLERMPEDWRQESAIAAAGPVASVAIAALAFLLATVAGEELWPVRLDGGPLLARLAWVNLTLAGFNLIPAFPLDGGRVLRALLERRWSRPEATRRAARVSTTLALAMIGLGVAFNVWLVVIGLFVMVSARAEEASVLVHAALGPVPVSVLAAPCPVVLRRDLAAAEAAGLAARHPQPAYPVVDPDGRPLGVVTPSALRRAPRHTPVGDLASPATVDAGASLEDLATSMAGGPVAVTSQGRIVGVVTPDMLDDYLRRSVRDLGR